jgi:sulfur-oxidizing protein SoxY
MQRRNFLLGLMSAALLVPLQAFAAIWNKRAFEAIKLNDVEQGLEINGEITSQDILVSAPDMAENGAIVQVEIRSNIPNTESLMILVEKNPTPLIAHYKFSNGAEPFIVTRIKMAETSDIKVIAKVGSQYFTNAKNVVVLENGCG